MPSKPVKPAAPRGGRASQPGVATRGKAPTPAPAAGGRSPKPSQTSVVAGRRPVLELLKAAGAIERVLIAGHVGPSEVLADIRRRAEAASVPVSIVPKDEIARVAGGVNHQGVAAITARYRYASLESLLQEEAPCILLLDGVTDPHNLGSLLRSADGAGFHGVVVPAHRSAGVTDAVRRVSAGAAEFVPVARVSNLTLAINAARDAGLWVVGLDEKSGDDVWSSNLLQPPVALVLGAEDRGISRNVRQACDAIVGIPFAGKIGSLNVGVAGAVAMFEVARRKSSSATL